MALILALSVNGTDAPAGRYLGWTPSPAALRVLDPDGATAPIRVVLGNRTGAGGKLVFRADRKDPALDELTVDLAVDGRPSGFVVAGRFGAPSVVDGDAPLLIRRAVAARPLLASFPLMVRIRKNANLLATAERDALLAALAGLNSDGTFQSFRNVHVGATEREAHGLDGFLPWHRGYVLDLERELQRRAPAVALPYWRFDEPAPRLFTGAFLGTSDQAGVVRFAPSNPLRTWSTDGQLGISRRPLFDTATRPANGGTQGPPRTEQQTIAIGDTFAGLVRPPQVPGRPPVRGLEANPHGRAHTSFGGSIGAVATAARDPLFFLLHCNVDRLWAKWQWLRRRFDTQSALSYAFGGAVPASGVPRVGHNLLDTMWPWNDVRTAPRPTFAPPRPRFPAAAVTAAPGRRPTVRSMIDYQAHGSAEDRLGFDYDDVPYQP